jgi:hypothetical protein
MRNSFAMLRKSTPECALKRGAIDGEGDPGVGLDQRIRSPSAIS